jgi:hypothetical protein
MILLLDIRQSSRIYDGIWQLVAVFKSKSLEVRGSGIGTTHGICSSMQGGYGAVIRDGGARNN